MIRPRHAAAAASLLCAAALCAPAHAAERKLELVSPPGNGLGETKLVGIASDGAIAYLETDEAASSADVDSRRDLYQRVHGVTSLVSLGSGPFDARFAGASADGSRVFFSTAEPLPGTGDTDEEGDVYLFTGGQITLVTPGDAEFVAAAHHVSDDGSRLVFETAERLTAADTDAASDLYERAGGETTLVSAGGNAEEHVNYRGASADGTRVFWETDEPLVAADTDAETDIYERVAGETRLVSTPGSADERARFVGASADGTRVFFSTSEPLVGLDADTATDLYRRSGGVTELFSSPGAKDVASAPAGISRDGSIGYFSTKEQVTAEDVDEATDVYAHTAAGTVLVSRGTANLAAAFRGASADGSHVWFATAEALDSADTNGGLDLYEHAAGVTSLVSTGPAGVSTNGSFQLAGASDDGSRVIIDTERALTSDDRDSTRDVYERAGGQTTLLSPGSAEREALSQGVSSDGARVFFITAEPLGDLGDADGIVDVYVSRLPQPPETTIVSGPSAPDVSATFAFTASEAGATFECRIDGGGFAPCASPFTPAGLGAGPHALEVRATDLEGDVDPTPAARDFAIAAALPTGPVPPGGAPIPADRKAPVISRASLSPRRFRAGRKGTTLRLRLSEAATVRIKVDRLVAGRKRGSRCVSGAVRGRRCTRALSQGTLTSRQRAGSRRIAITPRVGRRKLVPGSYRVTVTATDATGNRSAAKRLTFTVVR